MMPLCLRCREFYYLVDRAHMTPLAAINAGTFSAAQLLDIQGPPRGQITIGALADLVIVRGNPLDQIQLLESGVTFVMKQGKIARYDDYLSVCARCKT
jgi:imidazolonepropionase-like amidohydrolase